MQPLKTLAANKAAIGVLKLNACPTRYPSRLFFAVRGPVDPALRLCRVAPAANRGGALMRDGDTVFNKDLRVVTHGVDVIGLAIDHC